MCSSVRSTRHCLDVQNSKSPASAGFPSLKLQQAISCAWNANLWPCGRRGLRSLPLLWKVQYSIQLDMFPQGLIIQMALCEELEDGHSPCTESRHYCIRGLHVRIVLMFIIYILPYNVMGPKCLTTI
jgi:hypothetical protein